MNHIKRLEMQRDIAQAEADALREGLRAIRAYVLSDKFKADPTVQVQDIVLRVAEAMDAGTDAAWEKEYTTIRARAGICSNELRIGG